MHKCLTNLYVHTCRICLCEKCMSWSHIQWQRHHLSLPSKPWWWKSVTIMSQVTNPIIVFSFFSYNWICSQRLILFHYLFILFYSQLCLENPEFNNLCKTFRLHFYTDIYYECLRRETSIAKVISSPSYIFRGGGKMEEEEERGVEKNFVSKVCFKGIWGTIHWGAFNFLPHFIISDNLKEW